MNIPNLTGLMKVGKNFVMANRPEILFGASITATLASVVLAAKGGYQARGLVDEEIRRRDAANEQEPALTSKEKIQLTWLCYMPAAITTLTAVSSTTGLHLVHVKEKKALVQAGLAAIEEVKTSAKEFEKANLGVVTEEERDKILSAREDDLGFAHIQNSDDELEELYLVRDRRTGRDRWANKRQIEEAIIEIGNIINGQGDADVNTFYSFAGFNTIPDGDSIGWSGVIPTVIWGASVRDDGRPVKEFSFRPEPAKGYDRNNL